MSSKPRAVSRFGAQLTSELRSMDTKSTASPVTGSARTGKNAILAAGARPRMRPIANGIATSGVDQQPGAVAVNAGEPVEGIRGHFRVWSWSGRMIRGVDFSDALGSFDCSAR